MALMDEFQEERDSIKNGTFQQKLQYFRDYYQWPIIISIIAVIAVISIIYHIVTAKDSVLFAAFFNCTPYSEDNTFSDEFIEFADIDSKKYDITVDTANFFSIDGNDQSSYTTVQKITTLVGAGAMDIMAGSGREFEYYANTVLFTDLRTLMSAEQIAKYEPYFYYVDMSLILDEDGNANPPEDLIQSKIPDPRKPEDMVRPVPVALYVDSCSKLSENFIFSNAESGVALGICINSSNTDKALLFIDYLFD